MPKKDSKKTFIWYSLRTAFWIMIALWILFFFILDEAYIFTIFFGAISIFTFAISIIHLTKYKKKTFAIVSLVFSSFLLLLFFVWLIVNLLF
ncbi:hypothetical protein ES703_05182 [subsurface metagenome]